METQIFLILVIVQGCIGMPVSLIEQRLRKDLTANLLAVQEAASKNKLRPKKNNYFFQQTMECKKYSSKYKIFKLQ